MIQKKSKIEDIISTPSACKIISFIVFIFNVCYIFILVENNQSENINKKIDKNFEVTKSKAVSTIKK